MSHPQHQLRVFIDDGPRAGETLSVDPEEDGSPPRRITLKSEGDLLETEVVPPDDGHPAAAATAYELADTDLDNGLFVYREIVEPPGRADEVAASGC